MEKTGQENKMDKADLLFKEYKLAIETQMHFNDMLWKIRSLTVSVYIVVVSTSIARFTSKIQHTQNAQTYDATVIIVICTFFLAGIALFDLLYFHRMLLGAVERSTKIEELAKSVDIELGITGSINKKVSVSRSCWMVFLLYAFGAVPALIYVFRL